MRNPYKSVYVPDHPNAFSNGCVFEHVLVAEKILGRYLKEGEVVHHLNLNKRDNSPENIIVFINIAAHTRFHDLKLNPEYLIKLPEGTYNCKKVPSAVHDHRGFEHEKETCPVCGGKMHHTSSMCNKCRRSKRKESIPSEQILRNRLICENGNFSKIGREYGVSDNAVRKWCKSYGLPFRSREWCKHGEIV